MRAMIIALAAAAIALAAAAEEKPVELKKGPGLDKVEGNCSGCHSLDYIEMNSPFLDRAGWERTVNKMVTVMGAPISAEEIAEITAYLDRYYGKNSAAALKAKESPP